MTRARIQKWVLIVGASLLGAGFLLAVQKSGIVPFSVSFGVMVAGGLCLVVWLAFLMPTTKSK
ncbi:hypothetical protein KGQ34_04650 [Patescibacteria group bacterium]|nr:hypothetical protein [Patescibacteria group bacterium]